MDQRQPADHPAFTVTGLPHTTKENNDNMTFSACTYTPAHENLIGLNGIGLYGNAIAAP